MSDSIRTSVIVVNRDDTRVAKTLEALSSTQRDGTVEVIVVDASDGRLDHIRTRFHWVNWIEFDSPRGSRRTIARQRNIGLRRAMGSTIAFVDANCQPQELWLDRLIEPISTGGASLVSGRVVSTGRSTLHDRSEPYDLGSDGYLTECGTINLAIKRDVFDAIGEFDEQLGFAEDVDLSWRAVDAGFKIFFAGDATVSHEWDGTRGDLERACRYGVGRVRLYRKHPSRRRRLATLDLNAVVYPIFLIGLPIALIFPSYVLILAVPLIKSRKNHPFATVLYGLSYGSGVLSEIAHIPVLKSQR